ncbi:MAG: hypothetical protein NZL89_05845 [Leptospiraceae bacterium]|nr:hypothetical protein [Leptospiraceae bacterium]
MTGEKLLLLTLRMLRLSTMLGSGQVRLHEKILKLNEKRRKLVDALEQSDIDGPAGRARSEILRYAGLCLMLNIQRHSR